MHVLVIDNTGPIDELSQEALRVIGTLDHDQVIVRPGPRMHAVGCGHAAIHRCLHLISLFRGVSDVVLAQIVFDINVAGVGVRCLTEDIPD